MLHEAMGRVRQMEIYFDVLKKAADADPTAIRENPWLKGLLRILVEYYEGGQWLRDYQLDEQGLFPQDLKRGVLAQDAVYNFLEEIK